LAHTFDEAVVTCVREGRIGDVSGIDDHLRTLAAEDVVESLETAEGSLGGDRTGARFLSYEAPFGVGYLVAVLREATS
jgi:aromatic ring-opening dioxygenase LigB subunit